MDKDWLRAITVAAANALSRAKADQVLTKSGIRSVAQDFIQTTLQAVSADPGILSSLTGNDDSRLQSILQSLITAASKEDIVNHLNKDGVQRLLSVTLESLSANPEVLFSEGTSKHTAALFSGVVGVIAENLKSSAGAEALAKTLLVRSLAIVAEHPELLGSQGKRYSDAITSVAQAAASLITAGNLKQDTANQLVGLIPGLLLENPGLFGGKHRNLAGGILAAVVAAQQGALAKTGADDKAAKIVLQASLEAVVTAVYTSVSATAAQKLQSLTIAKADALVNDELVNLVDIALQDLLPMIGQKMAAGSIAPIIQVLVHDWGAGKLLAPSVDSNAFTDRLNDLVNLKAA